MNKNLCSLVLLILISFSLYSNPEKVWQHLSKVNNIYSFEPELVFSNDEKTVIDFKIGGYYYHYVETEQGKSKIIDVPGASRLLEANEPDLVKLSTSIKIPDNKNMIVNVVDYSYTDFENINIAPSKGNLSRGADPSEIPFKYGDIYNMDKFYPCNIAELSTPYIVRDYRGLTTHVFPFQYNPKSKILRVYDKIRVEIVVSDCEKPLNILDNNNRKTRDSEFSRIYAEHFLNYSKQRNPLLEEEKGGILIISYGDYMESMQPYVKWKNQIGHPTTIYDVSEIGSTPNTIKNFVVDYYNDINLTYLLLVGDGQHIPSFPVSTSQGNGYSDNMYSYIVGEDSYPDIFVGRFSAESISDVQTQVQRTLEYEKAYNLEDDWLNVAMGVARNEGASFGHNGESDCQHMDIIRDLLLTYNYNTVHQDYDHNCGSIPNTNSSQMLIRINEGVGLLNYCNHGTITGWHVGNFNQSHVNNLTNVGKLPFIWSVACLNGRFVNNTCFAETWLRATHNNEPTGALAAFMSTTDQSWHPPMDAQDKFNEILVGMHQNNIRRSFGGISMHGCMRMNELNGWRGEEMTDTWTIFGDPSISVRTDNPGIINIEHVSHVIQGSSVIEIDCDVDVAYIALTVDNNIIGKSFVSNGTAEITLTHQIEDGDEILVTATAYNKIPVTDTILVINAFEPPTADFEADETEILEGFVVSFSCLSTYVQEREWDFGDGNSSSERNPRHRYNQEGVYTVSLKVINDEGEDIEIKENYIHVEANTNPPEAGFYAQNTNITIGNEVQFTDTSKNLIDERLWHFPGGNPEYSTDENPIVRYNTSGSFDVSLSLSNQYGEDEIIKTGYINVQLPTYCSAGASSSDYEHITRFVLNEIDNSSGASSYSDFTNISTELVPGETYDFTVYSGNGYDTDQVIIWIDWERNGSFMDDGNRVFESETSTGPYSGSISVPQSISEGQVRLRIRLHDTHSSYNPNDNPCGNSGFGEVEDYTLFIMPSEIDTEGFYAGTTIACNELITSFYTPDYDSSYTFIWDFGNGEVSDVHNPIANYNSPGEYTVKLIVSNDITSDTIIKQNYIKIGKTPEFTINTSPASGANAPDGEASVNIIEGIAPLTVYWSNDEQGESVSNLLPGNYQVTVEDIYTCSKIKDFTIEYVTSVENDHYSNIPVIYPNPANKFIRIDPKNNTIEKLIITDLTGRIIKTKDAINSDKTIDVSNLSTGSYFINIILNNNNTHTEIIVIQ